MPNPTREIYWNSLPEQTKCPYSKDDIRKIISAIEEGTNLKLSPADKKQMLRRVLYAAQYFITANHQHEGPTPGQIKVALSNLHQAADKLLQIAGSLDHATWYALTLQRGEFAKAYQEAQGRSQSSDEPPVIRLGIIEALSKESKAAIAMLDKPRQPDKHPKYRIIDWEWDPVYGNLTLIDKFVFRLADIYSETTGEEPVCKHDLASEKYTGNIIQFVAACLEPIEGKPRKALGKTVDDALRMWRLLPAPGQDPDPDPGPDPDPDPEAKAEAPHTE